MRFGDFHLDIWANERKLLTRTEPISQSTTTPSYIIDQKTGKKKISTHEIYAYVKDIESYFDIHFKADKASNQNPMIAKIYVDGMTDGFAYDIKDSNWNILSAFPDPKNNNLYRFKFSKTSCSEENCPLAEDKLQRGGFHAVSVYWWRAELIDNNTFGRRRRQRYVQQFHQVAQGIINDKEDNTFSVALERQEQFYNLRVDTREKKLRRVKGMEPLAVLHLHYCRLVTHNLPRSIKKPSSIIKSKKNLIHGMKYEYENSWISMSEENTEDYVGTRKIPIGSAFNAIDTKPEDISSFQSSTISSEWLSISSPSFFASSPDSENPVESRMRATSNVSLNKPILCNSNHNNKQATEVSTRIHLNSKQTHIKIEPNALQPLNTKFKYEDFPLNESENLKPISVEADSGDFFRNNEGYPSTYLGRDAKDLRNGPTLRKRKYVASPN
ncbi:hypothetical protein G9A89_003785 [Geosiphon pyriformis]|nr:hypothetical protein G9A89_003785 [Geosiphon pyriformis]